MMKYEIVYDHNHPNYYYFELLGIISAIINKKSIRDELEKIVLKRGMEVREQLELFFKNSIDLENHIRANISFNFSGYQENGQEIADFLFKYRPNLDDFFAKTILYKDMLAAENVKDSEKLAILAFIAGEKFYNENWQDYPPKIDDDKELLRIFDNELSDSSDKFEIMKLYYDFELYYDYTNKLVEQAVKLYQEKVEISAVKINNCLANIEDQLKSDASKFFKDKLMLNVNDESVYKILASVYRVNSVTLAALNERHLYIVVGVHFFDIMQLIQKRSEFGTETIQDFLKCIADKTKLSIIQILKNERVYGSQLAERLNLTTATISQHMNILLGLRIVFIEKEKNKVYFCIDNQRLKELLDSVNSLLL